MFLSQVNASHSRRKFQARFQHTWNYNGWISDCLGKDLSKRSADIIIAQAAEMLWNLPGEQWGTFSRCCNRKFHPPLKSTLFFLEIAGKHYTPGVLVIFLPIQSIFLRWAVLQFCVCPGSSNSTVTAPEFLCCLLGSPVVGPGDGGRCPSLSRVMREGNYRKILLLDVHGACRMIVIDIYCK